MAAENTSGGVQTHPKKMCFEKHLQNSTVELSAISFYELLYCEFYEREGYIEILAND